MLTVTIHAAKTQLSKLIEQAEAGEEVIIARCNKPVVRLVPVEQPKPERRFGSMKGRVWVGPEFFEPLPEDELSLGRRVRVLLDTHAFLSGGSPAIPHCRIPRAVRSATDRTRFYVSAGTVWEIVTKHRLGKLPGAAAIAPDVEDAVAGEGFVPLAVTMRHAQRAGMLPGPHKDPFDRI